MEQTKLDRINFLYKKEKETGLTPEEKEEQKELRHEYVLLVRASLRGQLESITIKDKDGTLTSVKQRHDEKYKKTDSEGN